MGLTSIRRRGPLERSTKDIMKTVCKERKDGDMGGDGWSKRGGWVPARGGGHKEISCHKTPFKTGETPWHQTGPLPSNDKKKGEPLAVKRKNLVPEKKKRGLDRRTLRKKKKKGRAAAGVTGHSLVSIREGGLNDIREKTEIRTRNLKGREKGTKQGKA